MQQNITNNNVVNLQTNITDNSEDINLSNEEMVEEVSEEVIDEIDTDDTPGTCKEVNITITCEDTGTGFKIIKNIWAKDKPTHPLAIMVSHLNKMIEDVLNNSGMKPLDADKEQDSN